VNPFRCRNERTRQKPKWSLVFQRKDDQLTGQNSVITLCFIPAFVQYHIHPFLHKIISCKNIF